MAESVQIDRKLSDIFEEAFDLYDSLDECTEPTNSAEVQTRIKKCMHLFEDCTRLVSIGDLFSENESYKELPTNSLKYLMLPFFLGILAQKLCGQSRHNIVEVAETYFNDFLKRCEAYELHESNENRSVARVHPSSDEQTAITNMVLQRNAKLEKYRQKKELEDQVKEIKGLMKLEHVDDDVKRDFYVKLLKSSVLNAQEELSSIAQEKQILEFQRNRPESERNEPPPRRPVQPLKPIIITKDLAQKAVYGLGYPSMPTMTVDEFYDQRVRDGIFPNAAQVKANQNSLQQRAMRGETSELDEQEEIEQEQKIEDDDEYELARARARDDYKDEHRRGEGNRHNRS